MQTYVGFLRAINVTGHATVRMRDLQQCFTAVGCRGVRSYIQSGNIVFEAAEEKAPALFRRIERRLREEIGDEALVLFRTARALERIVQANPFRELTADRALKLCVTFLAARPRGGVRLPRVSEKERLETIAMKNLDVFTVSRRKPNNFYGFPNNFVEKELGVAGTTRNWSTVTKIVALTGAKKN